MGYAVYVQKFENGERAFAPFGQVSPILEKYGRLSIRGNRAEFIPNGDDICEVGFLGVTDLGVDGIGFERPISGGRLPQLVFELLSVPGFCFFEQDVSYVLARTDVYTALPEGLRELCASGACTVISRAEDVAL
jgi:hypothetical protein